MASNSKFKSNKKTKKKLEDIISTASLDSKTDTITKRCKFNFHYFDHQENISQKFEEWEKEKLDKLLNKLKNYSEKSLDDWSKTPIGGRNFHILEIYDNFPTYTDFTKPKHIPAEVKWARFRLEQKVRLIGFVIPESYEGTSHSETALAFDRNTFYIVYLDKNHRFWKTEDE